MALNRNAIIRWYGHACVEVCTPGGKTVLIDPWFGNPRSPRPAESVDACDLLLVTHGHDDHMGEAVQIARATRPVWPAIHEMSLWAMRVATLGDGVWRCILREDDLNRLNNSPRKRPMQQVPDWIRD